MQDLQEALASVSVSDTVEIRILRYEGQVPMTLYITLTPRVLTQF